MRSLKLWAGVAVLAAFFFVMPCGYAEPRDGWSLEGRVPAETLAMLTLEDVGGMGPRFERTAIAGLFREPEMKAFAQPILDALAQLAESEDGAPFGEATPLIMGLFEQLQGLRGQVAVALVDLVPGDEMPRAAMSMDFGPNVSDFAVFLDGLRKEIDPQGEAITAYEKDGRTWWQLQDGPPLTATTVDSAFVLATDPTLLESVIAGGGGTSLGVSDDFGAVRERAGGDSLALFAYANVPAMLRRFGSEMPRDARRIGNALGLDTVRAAAYGMAFAGDGFMDSFILHAPAAQHGLVPLLRMPAYEPKALALVPENAFYYEEGALDWSKLLPNIRELVRGVESNAVEGMDDFLKELDANLGVSLEDELLAGLAGGAASYVSMPQTGGLFPELAVMLQVKDPAAYEDVLERLTLGAAGMLSEAGRVLASTRTLEYHGVQLHMLELQRARGKDVVPFTPTWALLGDWWVLTLVPHTMKEIVLRRELSAGAGLAAQEDFQSLRAVMPPTAGAMSYVDLQAVLAMLYDTAVPLLQTAAKPNVLGRDVPFPLDWAQLPAARTVRPYFRSLGVFTTWNADGICIQMHGPVPLAGVMMVAAAVAVPAMMVGGRRMEARSVRREAFPARRPPRAAKDGERKGPRVEPDRPTPPGPMQPPADQARVHLARQRAEDIASFVRVFLLTQNRLPVSLDELVSENVASSLPNDPWRRAYRLDVRDAAARSFVVRSAGADGAFGTEDDVTSSE